MNAIRQAIASLASKIPKPPGGNAPSSGAVGKLVILASGLGLGAYGVLNSMYQGRIRYVVYYD